MTVGSNYGIYGSPFATNTNLFDQDFMYSATMPYGQGYNPSFNGISSGLQMQAQPVVDTFQKEGSNGWGTGTLLGLGAGGLATGGMYYLGGDSITPFKDGKIPDTFLKTVEKDFTNDLAEAAKNKIATEETRILTEKGITYNATERLALRRLAENGMEKYVSEGYDKSILERLGIIEKEAAQAKVNEINTALTDINRERLTSQAHREYLRTHSIDGAKSYLEQLRNQENLLKGMKEDGNLAKFIENNAKAFGIEGTEKEIEAQAKVMAEKMGGTQKSALKYFREVSGGSVVGGVIKEQEGVLAGIRSSLKAEITPYLTEGGKGLVEGAPKNLTKAFNSCKFKAAGKWGIAAGIAGLVLGKILG